MTEKETKQKGEGKARAEGSQGFGEMCREMMARGGCDCCGPQMREMMSRFRAPAEESKGKVKE